MGNAILAFGAEGGRRLKAMMEQQMDKQLADLAWRVLYFRQGMENFCPLPEPEDEFASVYDGRPGIGPGATREGPSPIEYSPLNKE